MSNKPQSSNSGNAETQIVNHKNSAIKEFLLNGIFNGTANRLPKSCQLYAMIWIHQPATAEKMNSDFWFKYKNNVEVIQWVLCNEQNSIHFDVRNLPVEFQTDLTSFTLNLDFYMKDIADRIEFEKIELESYHEKIETMKGKENFWNFYHVEQIEYSPAEGGCFYFHFTPVACFPESRFKGEIEAKEFARENFGLIFDNDRIETGNGESRPAWKMTSCVAEVDGEIRLESFPFQSMTTEIPHYE